jgi:glycosyltransferase involved in cell wall biosynthesis
MAFNFAVIWISRGAWNQSARATLQPHSICFVSRYAHYVLLERTEVKVGGAEIQQAVIAMHLRNIGWDVSFITESNGDKRGRRVNGIRVFPVLDYQKRHPAWTRLIGIPFQLFKYIRKSNAKIIYQRNPGSYSLLIGLLCKILGKKFILAGAHDTNFMPGQELNVNSQLDRLEIKYGIMMADLVILQNERQKALLRKNYKKSGPVLYNIYNTAPGRVRRVIEARTIKKILWVGRLSYEKRPELCLELAGLLPEYEIIMVGARTHKRAFCREITDRASAVPNLTYMGHLPLKEVESLFSSVGCLINTSLHEGFPNTFLQAWSRGIPVFSFVDPDNLIASHGLGESVTSVVEMAEKIKKYLEDPDDYARRSDRIQACFSRNFLASSRIREIEHVFLSSISHK